MAPELSHDPALNVNEDTYGERKGRSQQKFKSRLEEVKDVHAYLRRHNALCRETLVWSETDRAREVKVSNDKATVTFHPSWSNGTAGIRSATPLVGQVTYWEVNVGHRVFGTSLMVGVASREARLETEEFKQMLGEDSHGWALSHRGFTHHGGSFKYYCTPFQEHTPTVVGVMVDRRVGDVTFYKDGLCLGVAFTDLDLKSGDLYPAACSTAAKSVMTSSTRWRDFLSLQDRCRHVVASCVRIGCTSEAGMEARVGGLPLPRTIKEYILSL